MKISYSILFNVISYIMPVFTLILNLSFPDLIQVK